VAAGQLGLTGRAQPIFFPKSTKNKYTTPTTQEICSNYSIRRWSFLFISDCKWFFLLKFEIPTWFLLDKKYLIKNFELKNTFFYSKIEFPVVFFQTFFQLFNNIKNNLKIWKNKNIFEMIICCIYFISLIIKQKNKLMNVWNKMKLKNFQ
jgi:hypothetical protein